MDKTGDYVFNVYDKNDGDICENGGKIIRKEIGKLKRMTIWCF
jgi:hypothetical protein